MSTAPQHLRKIYKCNNQTVNIKIMTTCSRKTETMIWFSQNKRHSGSKTHFSIHAVFCLYRNYLRLLKPRYISQYWTEQFVHYLTVIFSLSCVSLVTKFSPHVWRFSVTFLVLSRRFSFRGYWLQASNAVCFWESDISEIRSTTDSEPNRTEMARSNPE